MKPSSEEKARFFAQYWDQLILIDTLIAVNGVKKVNATWNFKHSAFCLLLKPLSSITDDDAIEVAKQMAYDDNLDINGKSQVIHWEANWKLIPLISSDYLRSKGYALPWNGHSVEEMIQFGWVKINQIK